MVSAVETVFTPGRVWVVGSASGKTGLSPFNSETNYHKNKQPWIRCSVCVCVCVCVCVYLFNSGFLLLPGLEAWPYHNREGLHRRL